MSKIIEKTVESKYAPHDTNVSWLDVSGDKPVKKYYINGKWVEVGSGGGTKKYSDLEEKPLINGVELDGNKTSQDLGVYSKPSSGIPQSDLAQGVQTSLNKADTAYQKPLSGIPDSDLSSDVQQALQKHFKGWLTSTSQLPSNPVVGDYAYVEDSGTTYIYRCSTDGEWPETSTEEKDPVDVTFAGGEEVNQVTIDDTHLASPTQGSIPLALDVVGKLNQVGVTASAKDLIIALFRKCAFITDDAGDDIDDLEEEFEGMRVLVNITATMPQTYTIYDNQSVEILRDYLTVTAEYDDGSISTATAYTLSGELTEGTSVITVSYGGLTTTVSVTVTHYIITLTFTNDELLKRIGLSATYNNNGSAIPYCAINDKRVGYPYFDKLITGGKTFTISLTSSDSRTKVGLQCFTESALTKVANNQDIINATPGSPSIDGFDTGWISFSNGLTTITIPEKSTSDALSVIRGVRVSMKVDDGSSGVAEIPNDYTAELTITENNS